MKITLFYITSHFYKTSTTVKNVFNKDLKSLMHIFLIYQAFHSIKNILVVQVAIFGGRKTIYANWCSRVPEEIWCKNHDYFTAFHFGLK